MASGMPSSMRSWNHWLTAPRACFERNRKTRRRRPHMIAQDAFGSGRVCVLGYAAHVVGRHLQIAVDVGQSSADRDSMPLYTEENAPRHRFDAADTRSLSALSVTGRINPSSLDTCSPTGASQSALVMWSTQSMTPAQAGALVGCCRNCADDQADGFAHFFERCMAFQPLVR